MNLKVVIQIGKTTHSANTASLEQRFLIGDYISTRERFLEYPIVEYVQAGKLREVRNYQCEIVDDISEYEPIENGMYIKRMPYTQENVLNYKIEHMSLWSLIKGLFK